MGGVAGQLYFDNYSPVGDITVIATCFVILVLIFTSYVNKTRSFYLYLNIVAYLMLAAFSDVIYHHIYSGITDGKYTAVYVIRCLYHGFLFSNLLLYVVYIVELQHLEREKKIPTMIISSGIYISIILTDIITTVSGTGFRLNKDGTAITGHNIFLYGYLAFVAVIIFLMVAYRDRVYKYVMYGFYGTMIVAFLILFLQGKHGQSSFTVVSFMFPTIGMLYLVHSTPYDIELGAINVAALKDMVEYNYRRKVELLFFSLYIPEYDSEGAVLPKTLQDSIRKFSTDIFHNAVLFQVSNAHIILMAKKKTNPDYENKINRILNYLSREYDKYGFDYKVVMGECFDEISKNNEFVSFIKSIHRNMEANEIHMVGYEDVEQFERYETIINEIADIYRGKNLRDPRVLAYCQPVYNIKTGKYDTAEALMRLKIPGIGIIFPDQFIPLAEENGYIHVLTEIILQKTCDEIRYLLKEGYEVNRISVNVAVSELKEESFTQDIHKIICESGIPEEKVAIEITESQTESDFIIMKHKIEELKEKGIKFYLDDFGTGYSNMERIMELPFDIIKFDRSLVLASGSDLRSEKMVESMASMFSGLDYSVLYEGVENEEDEKKCIDMSASYLQGYKYSKPIPIMELKRFFSKVEESV